MGRRWSDIPWIIEAQADPGYPPLLLARCMDKLHACYLASRISQTVAVDITVRDAANKSIHAISFRYNNGTNIKAGKAS